MAEPSSARPSPRPSSAFSSAATGTSAIQVVVRLRPMNESEKRHGTLPVVTAKTAERSVTVIRGKGRKQLKSSYSFDDVFTAFSTQEEVFEATVKPVIREVMRGYEATVFAYGQTGTGKTHTMEGSLDRPETHGVIPRSAQAIFEHLRQPRYTEERVTCSCLEIYNEELRDLLADTNTSGGGWSGGSRQQDTAKLDIMEGKNGPFCRGLTERQVHSASGVLNLMQRAQHSRMIGETKMNKSSSRSHCLFTIQVHGRLSLLDGDGEMAFSGKLHMVDLAGSECAKSAEGDVARERERLNINRSLLTLGRVITVLKEKSLGKKSSARIPYRDSKLTRVLQEALGGRCKTVIVATISPSITAIEESVSTLNYAHSANGIVNKPVSSSLISLGESMSNVSMGIDSDSKSPATIESWQEMEMRLGYMQAQVDEAQAALARKHLQQQELQERAEKAEGELLQRQKQLHDANREIKSLKGALEQETKRREGADRELRGTQVALKKMELVLKATRATESALTSEARALIDRLEEMAGDRDKMHELVVLRRDAEVEKRKATRDFREAALRVLGNVESSFADLRGIVEAGQSSVVEVAVANREVGRRSVSEARELLSDIAEDVACVTDSIKAQLAGEGGLVPAVEVGSNAVLLEIQSAGDELVKGEQSFEESRQAMRRRLGACAKTLEGNASSLKSSTNEALQSFESNVVKSKAMVESVLMKLKNLMANLSEAKAGRTKALDSLVGQWKDQSLARSKAVMDASKSGSISLKNSLDEFQKKAKSNHEAMTKSLDDQLSFLDDTGSTHVRTIHEQGSLLEAHRRKLVESHDAQSKLRGKVMQSILSGVQILVSSEIEKLAAADRSNFQILDKDGSDLARTNETMTQSASKVVESVRTTNRIVSERSSLIHNNDLKASAIMGSSHSTLKEVMTSSDAHHMLVADFANKSLAAVSEMKNLNAQSLEVVETSERDGKALSASLVDAVFQPMNAEVNKMLQSSMDALAYVNADVVPKVNQDLDDASERRKSSADRMSRKFESAQHHLSDMAGRVTSIAKIQHGAAKRLGTETVAARDKHVEEAVPYYYKEMDSGRDKIISTMHDLVASSSRATLEGKTQGSIMKQSVEDFAQNTMQCAHPVDPAPARKECTYSNNLSSTPAEDEILQGIDDIMPMPLEALKKSSTADTRGKSDSPIIPDADTSHDSQDDNDTGSRKSSGSLSSLPSPRLKFRDTNVNHGDGFHSSKKLRKHHRHTVNMTLSARKNKCPSGQGTPSKHMRKRLRVGKQS